MRAEDQHVLEELARPPHGRRFTCLLENEAGTTEDPGIEAVRVVDDDHSYCGYVSAQRDRSKEIRGLHEPIVDERLFDLVQELSRARFAP